MKVPPCSTGFFPLWVCCPASSHSHSKSCKAGQRVSLTTVYFLFFLFIFLSLILFVYLLVVCTRLHQAIGWSVGQKISLNASIYLSISECLSSVHPSIRPSACHFVHLSICPSSLLPIPLSVPNGLVVVVWFTSPRFT